MIASKPTDKEAIFPPALPFAGMYSFSSDPDDGFVHLSDKCKTKKKDKKGLDIEDLCYLCII